MVSRSVVIALVLLVCAAGSAAAQEPPEPTEIPLTSWPTPPFWSPGAPAPEGQDVLGKAGIPSPPLPFVAVAPCRVADTRGNGAPIQGGVFTGPADVRDWTISGVCGIPAGAEAVSVNFTAVGAAAAGFLVAWPMGGAVPPVSVLNFNAGQTVANAAIVPLGTGAMTVNVSASTHVILDVNGYFGGAVTEVQQRVTGTCASGSSIRAISATGAVICEADDIGGGVAAWSLTGNAGTNPVANFIGTTDAAAFEIKVNGARAFRLEPFGSGPNVIGGSAANSVTAGVVGGTVAGGGIAGNANVVTDSHGTVGGGSGNRAGDGAGTTSDRSGATVAGGFTNVASGVYSTVGGGAGNNATNEDATVAGGGSNAATGQYSTVGGGTGHAASGSSSTIAGGQANSATNFNSTVGGGMSNDATGHSATIPGGFENAAAGTYAFAAGNRAKANHLGSFVWSDGSNFDFSSTAANQISFRAIGGARFVSGIDGGGVATSGVALAAGGNAWAPLSDRGAKENFCDVDEESVLERLASVPIETWNLKSQSPSIRHIGPMAQDFAAAFGVGEYDNRITTSDADGVAFAAIQALYRKLHAQEERIRELERRLAEFSGRKARTEERRISSTR